VRLDWFYHASLAKVYHEGWFIWLAVVICAVLLREPSWERSQLLIGYFAIWSLFGPLVHLAVPAAGPVFFDDFGFGTRFQGLQQDPKTLILTSYLLDGFTNREFNPGGGISAMPSVHLATMAWTILALRRTPWLPLAVGFTIYILFGSVVLGWHYAVDGLVGLFGGWLCYFAAGQVMRAGNAAPVVEEPLREANATT
jgi:membrane-associated phospholipid phosphatase